jgi:membrane protein
MVLLASVEASAVSSALAGRTGGHTHFAPYTTIVGLFAFLYLYMPNTRVRLWPAVAGALFGGLLWASMGAVFTRIVVYSAQLSAVYAGLAVVFLFLFWLYLSWLMLLLGAQLSFYVQHPEHLRTGHADIPMTGALRERIAMSAMALVARRHVLGEPRWTTNALAERLAVPATVVNDLVSALESHGLLVTAEDETLVPARDLDAVPLAAVLDAIRHDAPDPRRPKPRSVPAADAAVMGAEASMRASLEGRTLRDLAGGGD